MKYETHEMIEFPAAPNLVYIKAERAKDLAAEMGDQARQPAREARGDGAALPARAVPVKLDHHHRLELGRAI